MHIMDTASVASRRRLFRAGLALVPALCVVFGALLLSDVSPSLSRAASSVGLLTGGLLVIVSCGTAARHSTGLRRRSWRFLTAAASVALAGNIWVTAIGSHPVRSPSVIGEMSIALALLLAIAGLLSMPAMRHRGIELLRISLDGLVVGSAVLITTGLLDFAEILQPRGAHPVLRVTSVLFPLLDVVLATVAVLLIVRSRGDRAVLGLVGGGFLMYAAADLAFTASAAAGDFEFGTIIDLGWIAGYLLIALAAWHPTATGYTGQEEAHDDSATRSTLVVVGVIAVAIAAQGVFGAGEPLRPGQVVLWLLLVVATGLRQVLLTYDNTQLRRGLERRVREQTADLSRLVHQNKVLLTSVGDGIYGVDATGRVTFINPSGASTLGYEPGALLGQHAHDHFHAPRPDGTPYDPDACYVTEAITHGLTAAAEEDVYLCRDGREVPVEITASPLIDGDDIIGAVVVFRDVTQRREVERMKNEFLSVVSHELRTPLTSIRGSLGLLAGGRLIELTPQARRMVQIAVDSSERLTRLINDILDIERLETGTLPMAPRPQDAADLLQAAVEELGPLARSHDVTLAIGSSAGRVLADHDRILQTLTNLVGNALKFSPAGGVIGLEAVPTETMVTFSVRDQGRGIPADKLDSVFERFEQVDSSDSRERGGTGLGLAISRGIVEQHGGRIWAESEAGRGTTVRFTLPRLDGEADLGGDAALVSVHDDAQ